MRQTELHLPDEDRELIESCRAKGLHHAREVNRAHVLSALDAASWIARVSTGACLTAPRWLPRWTPGSSAETMTGEASRGRLLGRMLMRKWHDIMFRN